MRQIDREHETEKEQNAYGKAGCIAEEVLGAVRYIYWRQTDRQKRQRETERGMRQTFEIVKIIKDMADKNQFQTLLVH